MEAGRFAAGGLLPGERDLAERLGVSRTTLRRVLTVLVDEGRLTHRQGVGTFAAAEAEPVANPAARWTGFTDDMASRGCAASSREIGRAIVRPSPEETMMLACSPDDPVLRVTRILYADEQPIGIECAAAPGRLVGERIGHSRDNPERLGASLSDALAKLGLTAARVLQRVQAIILSDGDAGRLGVPPGSAGLVIRRAAYLADGRCCEVTRTVYRADRYDLVAELGAPARS